MDGNQFVRDYYAHLAEADVDAVVALYGPGAEIVRYDGVADTPDDIRAYHEAYLVRHGEVRLNSLDQLRMADDVLMWDALVDTDHGVAQVAHVVMFDDDGAIRRHVPGLRGYWGQ